MPAPSQPLVESAEWRALVAHHDTIAGRHLRELFADEPDRARTMVVTAGDVELDYSRNRLTGGTVRLLAAVARRAGLEPRRDAMFAGEPVNNTEGRRALHTALRLPRGATLVVDDHDLVPDIHAVLDRMVAFAGAVRTGSWTGASGEPIRTVVNIGIGGSDLGPRMATEALRHLPCAEGERSPDIRFVANVDGAELVDTLRGLTPESTLFIVASKTFTTLETMTNARAARSWLTDALGVDAVARHVVAVSGAPAEAAAFGVDPTNVFGFWDWVGGRYSLASAIGLPVMVAIGPDAFMALLAGMRHMDEHFRTAPIESNVPALAALIGCWHRDLFGWSTHAVIPYAARLGRLPAYLQQLDMESNGKSVTRDGRPVSMPTGPVVWGEPGTNGQHAFFQLLHQGATVVPVDLLAVANAAPDVEGQAPDHQRLLLANLAAQAAALAFGRTAHEVAAAGVPDELVAHCTFPGNRPSNVITVPALTPSTLGQLVAFYEHKVFTQAVLWDVNPFDQWGVELGKSLAERILPLLAGPGDADTDAASPAVDPATAGLVARWNTLREC